MGNSDVDIFITSTCDVHHMSYWDLKDYGGIIMNTDDAVIGLGLIGIAVFVFVFLCGFFTAYKPRPTELTNDCMIYEEKYYCPTDMPENLVMPVE